MEITQRKFECAVGCHKWKWQIRRRNTDIDAALFDIAGPPPKSTKPRSYYVMLMCEYCDKIADESIYIPLSACKRSQAIQLRKKFNKEYGYE